MLRNLMLFNGWGVVTDETGTHWVYIPLWDPAKFNEIGRAIFTTQVIKQHLAGITNEKAKDMLYGIVKEQAQIVSKGFVSAMDDGDEWCGTVYPHHPHGVITGPVGDPDNPVYRKTLGEKLSAQVDAKIGIGLLGKTLNNDQITQIAEML